MNNIEMLQYFENHEKRFWREIHQFYWNYATCGVEAELYFYPDDKRFYVFLNPGGNSWLEDDHVVLCTNDGGDIEIEPGSFRAYVYDRTDQEVNALWYELHEDIEKEKATNN